MVYTKQTRSFTDHLQYFALFVSVVDFNINKVNSFISQLNLSFSVVSKLSRFAGPPLKKYHFRSIN